MESGVDRRYCPLCDMDMLRREMKILCGENTIHNMKKERAEKNMLNEVVDCSNEFESLENWYFIAEKLVDFDPEAATGSILFRRHTRKVRLSFNDVTVPFERAQSWVFPPEAQEDMLVGFRLEFSAESVRVRMQEECLPAQRKPVWDWRKSEDGYVYTGKTGSVVLECSPFRLMFKDKAGSVLTQLNNMADTTCLHKDKPFPVVLVRNMKTWQCHFAFSLSLQPGEKIFGGGESFTRLDKRGQKMVLYAKDPHGVEFEGMYKPIPFFLSSRGYGINFHTSAPLTMDIGKSCQLGNVAYLYEGSADVSFYFGSPKDILRAYTAEVGRCALPPRWSFGLWMSRITYQSRDEVLETARKLRENRIPCDVIHIDTGWFEEDWRCDYQFSQKRFAQPDKMIAQLREMGFRVSLWQNTYFTPENPLYREITENGYAVKSADGALAVRDAVLDLSNPAAVEWYQDKLRRLFRMGVSAIKADFGEAAPLHGLYASGRSGYFEHNLYPYRYNRAVYEVTKQETGEGVIWARSAWSGSQQYPVHWGGDADNSDQAMLATLRGGLSLGLCGFSFWSHDIGGFVKQSPEELYRRWLPFGMLTSHSRCHGAPPTEPWEYSAEFLALFRRCAELKYSLLPYIYSQAEECCENGFPMLRTLFFECPDDPGAWLIEDEYFFGTDLLVAPLFERGQSGRDVYLPQGEWTDYFSGSRYAGGRWHHVEAGDIPILLFAKAGVTIPHAVPGQCTAEMDWKNIEWRQY